MFLTFFFCSFLCIWDKLAIPLGGKYIRMNSRAGNVFYKHTLALETPILRTIVLNVFLFFFKSKPLAGSCFSLPSPFPMQCSARSVYSQLKMTHEIERSLGNLHFNRAQNCRVHAGSLAAEWGKPQRSGDGNCFSLLNPDSPQASLI